MSGLVGVASRTHTEGERGVGLKGGLRGRSTDKYLCKTVIQKVMMMKAVVKWHLLMQCHTWGG